MKNEHDNSNNGKRKSRARKSATDSATDNSSGQHASISASDGNANGSDTISSEQSRRTFIESNPELRGTNESGVGGSGRTGGRDNDSRTRARTDSGRTETGASETENRTDEIPVRVTKRRGRKPGSKNKTASAFEQATLISFIAIGLDAIYGSIALFAGSHWELSDDEASLLSQSVDTALKTLPEEYYVDVKKNIEKFIPWIGLAITAGSITIPRIQLTNKLRIEKATVTYSDTDSKEYRKSAAYPDFAASGTDDYGLR